jgi:hypothetical protein
LTTLIDIPRWALGTQELWTPDRVLHAHAFAERVFRAMPGSIGPRSDRAYWPEYEPDPEERTPPEEEDRFRPSRQDITRAEWVLVGFEGGDGSRHPAWRNGALVGYQQQRRVFLRWSRWASFGKRTFDGVTETEEEFARRLGIAERTMRRQRDFAASVVARTLNDAELAVWFTEKPKRKNNRQASGSD